MYWNIGVKRTPETLAKLRKALAGVNKGRHHTLESRMKMSKSQTGRKHSEETKRKMSLSSKGRIFTKEHLKNMSLSRIGKKQTKEQIQNRVQSLLKNGKAHGRILSSEGYVLIYSPEHPITQSRKNKYVPEHRLIMEKHIGRLLKPTEVVHHINKNVADNNIINLLLLVASSHLRLHHSVRGICSIPSCGKPHRAFGLCNTHYARKYRAGGYTVRKFTRPLADS